MPRRSALSERRLSQAMVVYQDAETLMRDRFESLAKIIDIAEHSNELIRTNIGWLERYWNDFDRMDEHTHVLHTTKPCPQPWITAV